MTEWGVFGVITALAAFWVSIVTPIIKLNASIVRLIDRLNRLDEGVDVLTEKNQKSHGRMWDHMEEQDGKLNDHEMRITILEEKEK